MINIENCKPYLIHCVVQRLGAKESIECIKEKAGIEIQQSTYYKYRKIIKDSRFKRMREIADTGHIDYHLDAIDTLEWVKKEMVCNYNQEKDPTKKIDILTQIVNLLPYFTEYIVQSKEVMNKIYVSEQSQINNNKTNGDYQDIDGSRISSSSSKRDNDDYYLDSPPTVF